MNLRKMETTDNIKSKNNSLQMKAPIVICYTSGMSINTLIIWYGWKCKQVLVTICVGSGAL